jgi:hypothetical protein
MGSFHTTIDAHLHTSILPTHALCYPQWRQPRLPVHTVSRSGTREKMIMPAGSRRRASLLGDSNLRGDR